MFKTVFLGAILSATLCGAAQAALVDVTYEGMVTIGSDATGTSLHGTSVTVTYRFDTAGVPLDTQVPGGMNYSGGSLFFDASPAISATVTLGTTSVSFAGDFYGVLAEQSTADYSFQSHQASSNAGPYVYSSVTAAAGALPATLLEAYTYTVKSGDNAFGYFDLANGTTASFAPTLLQETVVSAVPLPPALPLFASALLAVAGFGVYRRRDNRVHTA